MRLQEKPETVLQSEERDECISRMAKWPVILKAVLRLRKMLATCPLFLATWVLLVTTAREDLVERLGQRPGWRDLNCVMESEEVEGVFVDISLRSLAKRDSREMWWWVEGI